jgi:hypothetical protein
MTREEIHKLPWKAQEYIHQLERKLTLTDVVHPLVCNYCLEQVSTLPDDFGCQSCIDNYK